MADYISREEAVEKIKFLCELREIVCNHDDEFLKGLKNSLNAVKFNELIPSADVQPVKHGRWSECYTDTHHYSGICSVCGKASIKSLTESLYAFCPKCGARMDGEKK